MQKEMGHRRASLHQISVLTILGPAFCGFSLVGLIDLARSCSKGAVAVTGCLCPEEEEEEEVTPGVVL